WQVSRVLSADKKDTVFSDLTAQFILVAIPYVLGAALHGGENPGTVDRLETVGRLAHESDVVRRDDHDHAESVVECGSGSEYHGDGLPALHPAVQQSGRCT